MRLCRYACFKVTQKTDEDATYGRRDEKTRMNRPFIYRFLTISSLNPKSTPYIRKAPPVIQNKRTKAIIPTAICMTACFGVQRTMRFKKDRLMMNANVILKLKSYWLWRKASRTAGIRWNVWNKRFSVRISNHFLVRNATHQKQSVKKTAMKKSDIQNCINNFESQSINPPGI